MKCIDCKNWSFDAGSSGAYSEVTPGESASFICSKNHWLYFGYEITHEILVKELNTNRECVDFEKEKRK